MEIIINVLLALLSAFLGGYFGAWFQHSFQNRKVNKVRKIAIKALDVFSRYAKQGQTFDKATSEFNNSLDVVEKRAVLVALCKLGIPVVKPINDLFQIEDMKFEHKLIDKDTLELMKGQVNRETAMIYSFLMSMPISHLIQDYWLYELWQRNMWI